MIVGHRGCKEKPENTMSAFEYGLELGLRAFEFDVHKTADNHLVVFHDETLDRTTNTKGFLKDKTLLELKELDAGSGEKIPSFSELLDLFSKEIVCQIEIKADGCEEEIVKQIQARQLYQNAAVVSFNHQYLKKIKELDPKIDVVPIIYAKVISPLKLINELEAVGISMNEKFIDNDIVETIKKNSKTITAWTVNSEDKISWMVNKNIDFICTDYPSKCNNYIF